PRRGVRRVLARLSRAAAEPESRRAAARVAVEHREPGLALLRVRLALVPAGRRLDVDQHAPRVPGYLVDLPAGARHPALRRTHRGLIGAAASLPRLALARRLLAAASGAHVPDRV